MNKTATVIVFGLPLDIEYSVEIVKDPYATGDSPTQIMIEIDKILLESHNLNGVLSNYAENTIRDKLLTIERNRE